MVFVHSFPKSPRTLKVWIEKIGIRGNFSWSKNKVICSRHFPDSDYTTHCSRNVLKLSAVPSLCLPNNSDAQVEVIPATSRSTHKQSLKRKMR